MLRRLSSLCAKVSQMIKQIHNELLTSRIHSYLRYWPAITIQWFFQSKCYCRDAHLLNYRYHFNFLTLYCRQNQFCRGYLVISKPPNRLVNVRPVSIDLVLVIVTCTPLAKYRCPYLARMCMSIDVYWCWKMVRTSLGVEPFISSMRARTSSGRLMSEKWGCATSCFMRIRTARALLSGTVMCNHPPQGYRGIYTLPLLFLQSSWSLLFRSSPSSCAQKYVTTVDPTPAQLFFWL